MFKICECQEIDCSCSVAKNCVCDVCKIKFKPYKTYAFMGDSTETEHCKTCFDLFDYSKEHNDGPSTKTMKRIIEAMYQRIIELEKNSGHKHV